MKNRKRDVLKLQGSDSMRSLLVERELSDQGWRCAISELNGEVLIEEIVEQAESRQRFQEMCTRALGLVLA